MWPRALELVERPGPRRASAGAHASAAELAAHASAAELAARAVAAHCRLVLEAVADECVAVKPQVACFERLGAPGWAALREVVGAAGEHGLLVIADAKRGDIDISARAYGQAFFGGSPTPFGHVDGLGADALTVSPLLGRDSLMPLVEAARAQGGGILALVRTSNPGAADLQDSRLVTGGSVSEALARIVDELGAPGIGQSGLSDVGAVTGATAPEHLESLRELMPHAVLLLPGIGPQGASGRDLAPAFAPGAAAGLVTASRAIVHAADLEAGSGARAEGPIAAGTRRDPAAAARAAAGRLREMVWDLYA